MPASAPALLPVVHLCRLLHAEAERLDRESPSSATRARLDETAQQLAEAEQALVLARQAR
jgi:hypothetical protein